MSPRMIGALFAAAAILGGLGTAASPRAAHAQQNQAPAPGQQTAPGMMQRGGGGMMGGGMMGNGNSGMGGDDMQQMMERCRTMMQGSGTRSGDMKEMMDRCRGTSGSSSPPAGTGGSSNPPPAASPADRTN